MTVTPVVNWPSALRKSRRSKRSTAASRALASRKRSASTASNHQGAKTRGSSKPLTMVLATAGMWVALCSSFCRCGFGGASRLFVQSVAQRA